MPPFTKQAIIASFLKLAENVPLEKITVKDIVEDCGVNRKTFYYYFKDIYNLIDEVIQTERKKIRFQQSECFSWEDHTLQMLQFLQENRKVFLHIYNSVNYKTQAEYLYEMSREFISAYINEQTQGSPYDESYTQLLIKFYAFATVGMALEWINNNMKEKPEEIVKQLSILFHTTVPFAPEIQQPTVHKKSNRLG